MEANQSGKRAGVGWFGTFSWCPPVASIHFLTVIACELIPNTYHCDAEQAFVQLELSEHVCMRLPKGFRAMSGNVAELCPSLYSLKQASRLWHHHLAHGMRGRGFENCGADSCLMRLVEARAVSIDVAQVDYISAMGLKSRRDKLCEELNQFVWGCCGGTQVADVLETGMQGR